MTRSDFEKASHYLTTVRLLTVALSAGLTFITFVDEKFGGRKNVNTSKENGGSDPSIVPMPKTESR